MLIVFGNYLNNIKHTLGTLWTSTLECVDKICAYSSVRARLGETFIDDAITVGTFESWLTVTGVQVQLWCATTAIISTRKTEAFVNVCLAMQTFRIKKQGGDACLYQYLLSPKVS